MRQLLKSNVSSVLAVATIVSVAAASANAKELQPPNVIVFLVDDLGYTDISSFGSSFYETPNVDRLAASAMRLTAAYSACPVCSPTRASIYTGRYPQRSGITDYINGSERNQPEQWLRNTKLLPASYSDRLSLDERTIAESLRDAGYATFFAGKWHLGPRGFWPEDQGFEINKGGCGWGIPKSYFSPYGNPRLPDGPVGEHLPARLADETCAFIEANAKRPFLAFLSFYSVHIPHQAPEALTAKYQRKAAALPATEPAWGQERASKVRLVQNHPTYAAMVESMDSAIGQVLDKLDELGLSENTVVLFTSDNGGVATSEGHPTSNLPLRAGKGWLYEGGIRVPTIIRWPGVTKAGSACATPIISIDYFPTLLEITGAPSIHGLLIDGQSIVPLLRGESRERGPIFWDYPHYGNQGGAPSSAVRNGRWKLIHWREDDSFELFDLDADVGETTNVAADHTDVVARLRRSLDDWRNAVGAKPPTANPCYRAAE